MAILKIFLWNLGSVGKSTVMKPRAKASLPLKSLSNEYISSSWCQQTVDCNCLSLICFLPWFGRLWQMELIGASSIAQLWTQSRRGSPLQHFTAQNSTGIWVLRLAWSVLIPRLSSNGLALQITSRDYFRVNSMESHTSKSSGLELQKLKITEVPSNAEKTPVCYIYIYM